MMFFSAASFSYGAVPESGFKIENQPLTKTSAYLGFFEPGLEIELKHCRITGAARAGSGPSTNRLSLMVVTWTIPFSDCGKQSSESLKPNITPNRAGDRNRRPCTAGSPQAKQRPR
jgi:hypothetical protein